MSVQDKQVLVRNMTRYLEDKLTPSQIKSVVDGLTVQMSIFEVEAVSNNTGSVEGKEFLKTFLDAKGVEGRSIKTIKHYEYVIKKALDAIDTPIRQITVFHLRKYLMDMKSRGIQDKTIEGVRCVLCSFFGWLDKEKLLDDNPCNNLNAIKCAKKVLLPFSPTDIKKLEEHCKTDRDRAIIAFLLSTGCRIGEVCSLNRDSIDFDSLECIVYGKGAKERTVFLDDVSSMLVKRYLESRNDMSEALFIGKGSGRLTPGGVRFMLHKIADEAKVDNVHPHRFRRTLATNLIKHGMTVQEVASILGHDNINTTMKYVYIDKSSVKNNYMKLA